VVIYPARQVTALAVGVLACSALLGIGSARLLAQVEGTARILDGQTLEVAGERFHLQGVRAPALDQVCHRLGKPYPCGRVARAALWDLVAGVDVTCTPVPDAAAAHGGVPAICTAGETRLNERMVESGWALADPAAGDAYGALEDAAREAGRGLWRSEFDLPGAPRPEAE
jgi:endonuclease YncB( thermonuclease family)